MATKVGAFKKDGTVQCVKLVEETPSTNNELFSNGICEGGHISFSSGYQIVAYNHQNTEISDLFNSIATPTGYLKLFQSNKLILSLNFDHTESGRPLLVTYGDLWSDSSQKIFINSVQIGGNENISSNFIGSVQTILLRDPTGISTTFTLDVYTPTTVEYYSSSSFSINDDARFNPITVKVCKDGILKCRELIEEPQVTSVEGFNGKVEGGHITFNNGYVMRFKSSVDAIQETNIPYNLITRLTFVDTYQTSVFKLEFSGTTVTADLLSSSIWNNGQNTYLNAMGLVPSGNLSSYANYIFELLFDSTTGRYQIPSTITTSPVQCNYYGTPPLLPASAKLVNPTVRICKDGIIKCAKLQEANSWSYISWDNGTLTTDGTISLPNGYKFRLKNSNGVIKKFTSYFSFSLDSESTNIIHLSGSNGDSSVSVDNSDYLLDKQILIDSVSFGSPSQILTIGDFFEMTNPKGETYRLTCNEVEGSSAFFTKSNSLDSLMPIPITDRAAPQWI